MKRFSIPMVLTACLLAGTQLGGCKSDKDDENSVVRTALVKNRVARHLAIPVQHITLSMSERDIRLSFPHPRGCEGMGNHGAKDCRETLVVCLQEDKYCSDMFVLRSGHTTDIATYNSMMTVPATEEHAFAKGANIPMPQREWADDIRLMGQEAYRLLPVLMQ